MEYWSNMLIGFQIAFQPINFLYCFIGALLGTLIGVLPGIGPSGTICILLGVTFTLSPVPAIILLAGIYYGAMYGGSTTSILVNIPGEAASVVTCLDGYQMARQGRAGPALGIAAFGSFIAGTLSVVALMFLTLPLSKFALAFGPPEYFSLVILAFTFLVYLTRGSIVKLLITSTFGFLLSLIGKDVLTGEQRYTFNIPNLMSGLNILSVGMGLFGVGEVFANIYALEERKIIKTKIRNLLPTRQDWKDSYKPILRGGLIGFLIGIIPGGNTVIASFASYAVEKRSSKHPERFGLGAIEGVAGPEAANNAAFGGGLVPLLSLGIPTTVVTALLFAALMMHGITPGPFLIPQHPDVFWGLVASMYLGNVMLLVINLPLIGVWVQVLRVPSRVLFPLILLFCMMGVYSVDNSFFDVGVMMVFGILGYLMIKFDYEPAPVIFAFILGPILEEGMRQSLRISRGSFLIFFTRPIAAAFLILSGLLIISYIFFHKQKKRSG